ncbi:MAG: YopX family protein [Candidatus Magasanikbacteria bacterium]
MKLTLPELRFWHKDEKQMHYSPFHSGGNGECELYFIFRSPEDWECVMETIDYSDKDVSELPVVKKILFSSDNTEAMVDTGFLDKKFKAVFEGDIVQYDDDEPFVVEYEHGVFNLGEANIATHKDSGVDCFINLEVLGNVYEHPELKPIEM